MQDSGEPNSSAYKWCWGSILSPAPEVPGDRPVWNPLVFEMVTAGAVMLEMWERVLSPAQRTEVAEGFGAVDERSARLAAGFLAGVSRVGHACPSQMVSFDTRQRASPDRERACAVWREQAMKAGLPLPLPGARLRHAAAEHVTAAVLPRLTGCDCPGLVDGERCRAHAHQGLYTAAYALNRQGADVLHADTVAKAYRATGGAPWDVIRMALVDAVARHVGIAAGSLPSLIRPSDPLSLTAFSGLVSQSVALSREDVAGDVASPHEDWETTTSRAHLHARSAVGRIGVGG
ncbi:MULTISPECIES: HD domain-containing protein [unclassified Streptomyces]|uniref:HD domain-containing protein n=1 Tax=unclassified Streptomyces TaxID=2593676 RepID=UPI002E315D92|nr:HD domain-containing protein [Streptomyces sp. NBC_01460]